MEQGFSVYTLSIPFRKPSNIISNKPSLGPFRQRLPGFDGIVGRLEVAQQRTLQVRQSRHITLDLVPGVGLALKQPHH